MLLVHDKPKPALKEVAQHTPTLNAFAVRFVDGYAKANRLKPSVVLTMERGGAHAEGHPGAGAADRQAGER